MEEYKPKWQHLTIENGAYLVAKPNLEYSKILFHSEYEIYSDGTIVENGIIREFSDNDKKSKFLSLLKTGEIGEKYHFGWDSRPHFMKDKTGAVIFLGFKPGLAFLIDYIEKEEYILCS